MQHLDLPKEELNIKPIFLLVVEIADFVLDVVEHCCCDGIELSYQPQHLVPSISEEHVEPDEDLRRFVGVGCIWHYCKTVH